MVSSTIFEIQTTLVEASHVDAKETVSRSSVLDCWSIGSVTDDNFGRFNFDLSTASKLKKRLISKIWYLFS